MFLVWICINSCHHRCTSPRKYRTGSLVCFPGFDRAVHDLECWSLLPCVWRKMMTALTLQLIRPYHIYTIGRNEHDLLATEQVQECVLALSMCPEKGYQSYCAPGCHRHHRCRRQCCWGLGISMTLVVYPPRVNNKLIVTVHVASSWLC